MAEPTPLTPTQLQALADLAQLLAYGREGRPGDGRSDPEYVPRQAFEMFDSPVRALAEAYLTTQQRLAEVEGLVREWWLSTHDDQDGTRLDVYKTERNLHSWAIDRFPDLAKKWEADHA